MRRTTGLSIVLLFAMTACAAAPAADTKPTQGSRPPVAIAEPKPAAAAPTRPAAADAGQRQAVGPALAASGVASAPVAPAVGAPADAKAAAPAPAVAGQTGTAYESNAASDRPWDRMIIKNGTLSLVVENVERALAGVRQVAGKHGGFVSASSSRLDKIADREQMAATVTVQVRAREFDEAVSELRALATKVEAEVGSSQDVTEEYVDVDASLRNLQKTEARLAGLMEKATNLSDVLVLQRELTSVRGQIERIEGRKRFLENRTELAQISLTLQQPAVVPATPTPIATPVKPWDPAATASVGWEASLRILRAIADVGILAFAFGWWLIPPLAVAGAFAFRARTRSVA